MKRLLDRIGLDAAPAPDLEGLRRVHRAAVVTRRYTAAPAASGCIASGSWLRERTPSLS